MSSEIDSLADTAKRFALLAQALDQHANNATAAQQASAQAFSQSVTRAEQSLQQIAGRVSREVEAAARHAADQGLQASLGDFGMALGRELANVRATVAQADAAARLQRRTATLTLIVLGGGIAALLLGAGLLVRAKLHNYQETSRALTALHGPGAVALARGLGNCDGQACLRLRKIERWGRDKDYVLLELEPVSAPATPAH